MVLYKSFFFPSGLGMVTAFPARALVAAGMVVLHTDEDCPSVTPQEGCGPETRNLSSRCAHGIAEGSVDWFRFWPQRYEDPDPSKAEQYKRRRELKKLWDENEQKAAHETTQIAP